jgi:hypothetical protein
MTRARGSSCVAAAFAAALAASTAGAASRAIEDVRFVKQNGVARVEIVFACPVRYLSHMPSSGTDVQIRVALEPACLAEIGGGVRSELVDPPAGNLAGAKQVVFDTTVEQGVARVALDFGRVVAFDVSQGAIRNVLRVEIDETLGRMTNERVPSLEPPPPKAAAAAPSARAAAPERAASAPPAAAAAVASSDANAVALPAAPAPERHPLRLVQPEAARTERFAIQLAAAQNAAASADAITPAGAEILYINERRAGASEWQELKLGFFDTESAARARLASVVEQFPDAVIGVASVAEQDAAAAERRLHRDDDRVLDENAAARALPELSPGRIAALAAEADDAMLAQDYDRAIQVYTRLLEEPGYDSRQAARERLGLARERKGQLAQARREYDAYLAEYGDSADADRVRQRLASLVAAPPGVPREIETAAAAPSRWDYAGGVAQYYRRDVYEPLEQLPDSTLQSALISNFDLVTRRHGERFDLRTRLDAAYRYNLLEPSASREPADQLYVTNAYIDVVDEPRAWSARLGRQSLHTGGVLGRFDGAHAEYQWKPDVALNLTLGRPVDYPRHAIDAHRQFAAFSADIDELVKRWDMSFFGVLQQIDGIADRQAVGAEARFRGDEWSVVSAVDFDMSYAVLNSALVNANWRATPKLTVNGRLNFGASPFLMTRNSLIGQSVGSIDDLLELYSEGQVRRMARDRTSQVRDTALGLSWPVFDRYQLNVDVASSEYGATVASAGVPALPPSGAQTFFQATLVGSSVVKPGDTAIFSLRHAATRTATSETFVFDMRLPSARNLRLNPRIALTSRATVADDADQWIAAPQLRLVFRWPSQHRFELELGGQWSDKTLPPLDPALEERTEESSAYFVNAGYWWEF